MTTTTSYSNRTRFTNFFAGLLRRNSGYIIFLTLVEILFFPVQLALKLFSPEFPRWFEQGRVLILEVAPLHTEVSLVFVFGTTLVAAIVMGISQFSFLQSKRSVDVYHALPISRSTMFAANFLAAFTTVMIPLVVGEIGALIVGFVRSLTFPQYTVSVLPMLMDIVCWSAVVFAILACIAFAQVQVGRIFDGFLFAMELNFAPISLAFLTLFLFDTFLSGFNMNESFDMLNLIYYSPVAAMGGRYALNTYTSGYAKLAHITSWSLVLWVVLGAALVAGSLYLYNRRKSEIAESTVTTGPLAIAGKLAAVYVGGSLIGLIIISIFSGPERAGWGYVLWTVLGAAVVYFFMEFILLRGYRGLSKGLPLGLATIGLVGVFAAILVTGGLGFESRIPDLRDVKSVTINYQGRYADIEEYDASSLREIADLGDMTQKRTYASDYTGDYPLYQYNRVSQVTLTSPEAIEAVQNFHRKLIEYNESLKNQGLSAAQEPSTYLNLSLTYHTGGKLARVYNQQIPYSMLPLLAELENTEEYKKATHPVFRLADGEFTGFQVLGPIEPNQAPIVTDPAKVKQLLEAVRADMLEEDIVESAKKSGGQSVDIQFKLRINPSKQKITENYFNSSPVYVNASYTRTLALLRQMGYGEQLDVNADSFDVAFVSPGYMYGRYGASALVVSDYMRSMGDLEGYKEKMFGDENSKVTDPAAIRRMWDNSRSVAFATDTVMSVMFVSEDGKIGTYRFVDYKYVPESIQQAYSYIGETVMAAEAATVVMKAA